MINYEVSRNTVGGIGLAVCAGLMWGSLGTITVELLALGLTTFQLAMVRMAGAFIVSLLIAALLGKLHRLSGRELGLLALIGLFCQALSSFSFSESAGSVGSNIAIALLCLGPLFTAGINRLFFKEQISRTSLTMMLLTLAGLILMVLFVPGANPFQQGQLLTLTSLPGIGWGLVAGLCYGLFPVFARQLGSMNSWILVSYSCGFGALFLLPLQTVPQIEHVTDPRLWFWVAMLVLAPTIIADVCYVKAITLGGPLLATLFALVEVPASALYTWLLHDTVLTPVQTAGIVLFCIGLAGFAIDQRPDRKKQPLSQPELSASEVL